MKLKKTIIIIMCFLLMFCFAGCTKQEYIVQIHDNNNVDFTIKLITPKEQYNLLNTFDITLEEMEQNKVSSTNTTVDKVNVLFQEMAMLYHTYGFTITPIDNNEEIGFSAKKTYLSIEEFNTEIQKFAQGKISGLNVQVNYLNKSNKNEYYVQGTLDYIVDNDLNLNNENTKKIFEEQYDYSYMTAKATIFMPESTQITAFDGAASQESYSVEWSASYSGETKPVHIKSLWTDYTMYYIIGGGAFVILIIVVFFVARHLKLKKERSANNSVTTDDDLEDAYQGDE